MRYHYQFPEYETNFYGDVILIPNHFIRSGTIIHDFKGRGIIFTQQKITEHFMTHWGPVNPTLIDQVYLNENFYQFFEKYAKEARYPHSELPVITIRQAMNELGMKPLEVQPWETYFTKKPVTYVSLKDADVFRHIEMTNDIDVQIKKGE